MSHEYRRRDQTVYGIPLARSTQRKARREEHQSVGRLDRGLLQIKAAQRILKARLRTEGRPDRVDLQINQSGFGPAVAILKCIERCRVSAEGSIRLR